MTKMYYRGLGHTSKVVSKEIVRGGVLIELRVWEMELQIIWNKNYLVTWRRRSTEQTKGARAKCEELSLDGSLNTALIT